MNLLPLLQHSFFYGTLLAVTTCALFLLGAYLNPEVMLRGYPPDIKARYGPPSAKGQRQQKWLGLPVAVVLFGSLILAIAQLPGVIGGLTFMGVFLCVTIMLLTLNLVDLVVLDWLIFVWLQPEFIVLPGTAGLAGYRDYGFHLQQFGKGAAGSVISALIIAGATMLIYAAII